MRFQDTAAVVVGVGSTIGTACALRLADEGAHVLAVDPHRDVAEAVTEELGERGLAHTAGLVGEEDAAGVAARCQELWGRLDVLIDCGAAMETWPADDDRLDRWRDVIEVNLMGPATYTLALWPLLRRSPAGAIVYLGSIDGILGNPNVPAYSVAKGGLVPLTHIMAQRLAADGIRVNCVAAAGIVQIAGGSAAVQRHVGDAELVQRLTPLGRMPAADEIAAVMLFYASRDASYVTGTVLPVDGGRLAATPGTC